MSEAAPERDQLIERLEKIFYQLIDLLEQQAQERQVLIKEKEELGKLSELLISQTKVIGQYEAGIRKRIQDCIKDSSETAIKNIEDAIKEKALQNIDDATTAIKHQFQAVENRVSPINAHAGHFSWRLLSLIFGASVLSSYLLVWLFLPKQVLPLTNQQLGYLQEGQRFVQIWPKLTKQEQSRLITIYNEIKNNN